MPWHAPFRAACLQSCRVVAAGGGAGLLAAGLVLTILPPAAAEDLVLLANGQRIVGHLDSSVPTDPGQVAINTGNGIIFFGRDQVRGEDLSLATRLQRLASNDLDGTVHLARWARSKGLNKEALGLLDRALHLPGVDLPTRALHVRLVDELNGPAEALPWYAAYVQAGGNDPATLARYDQLVRVKADYDAAHGITPSAATPAATPSAQAGSPSSSPTVIQAATSVPPPAAGSAVQAGPALPSTVAVPAVMPATSAAGDTSSTAAVTALDPVAPATAPPRSTLPPVALAVLQPVTGTTAAAGASTPLSPAEAAAAHPISSTVSTAVHLPAPRADAWEQRSWDIVGAPESNPVELQQVTIPAAPDGPDQTLHPLAISYQGGELHKAVISRSIRFNLQAQPVLSLWVSNPNAHPVAIAMAVKTGRQWTYYESAPQIVRPGTRFQNLHFDFSQPIFKCAASDWQPTAVVDNADQAQEFQLLVLNEHDNGRILIYDMGIVTKDDL